MNIDFLKPVLGDDLFAQVSEKLASATGITLANIGDGSYIPKEKLEEERTTSKGYKSQISELNGKLAQLQEAANGNDALKAQITQLQSDLAAKDAALNRQMLEYRIKDTVRGSKAKNADVIMKMIDIEKIKEKNGELIGLDDQIEALKKSDAYLFEPVSDGNGGVDPHNEPGSDPKPANYNVNQLIRQAAGR